MSHCSKRLPEPDADDRESDNGIAWDLQAEVHHRMQQADERNGERRQRHEAIPAAAESATDENPENNDPRKPNHGGEREAEVGGKFKRCAMGKIPDPSHRVAAAVGWKAPNEGAKAGAEPRMVGDHVQGRAIGVEATFIGKVLRIETPVDRSPQDLHQEEHDGYRAHPQPCQAASFRQVTPKKEREGDDKGQERDHHAGARLRHQESDEATEERQKGNHHIFTQLGQKLLRKRLPLQRAFGEPLPNPFRKDQQPEDRAGSKIGRRGIPIDEGSRHIADISPLFPPQKQSWLNQSADNAIAGIGNARPADDEQQLAGPGAVGADDETERQSQSPRAAALRS